MIKAEIRNLQNRVTNYAEFSTQELAESWVEQESNNLSFGRIDRLLNENEVISEGKSIEDAEEVIPADDSHPVMYRFLKEFSVEYVEIVDPSIAQNAQEFLNATDWKVIRHLGQKALNIATSMTEEEYLALEAERQVKRGLI